MRRTNKQVCDGDGKQREREREREKGEGGKEKEMVRRIYNGEQMDIYQFDSLFASVANSVHR